MAIRLKVSTDVMVNKAGEISEQIATIERNWNKMKILVNNTKIYWQGEASDVHQKNFKQLEEAGDKVLKRLREHPDELLKMADVYTETERTIQSKASSLPQDVIS